MGRGLGGVGGGVGKCVGVWGEVRKDVWGVEKCGRVYGVSGGGMWESVWGEKVCWRVGKGCEERNGGGVGKYAGCGAPTHFPHLLLHFIFLYISLTSFTPNSLSYNSLSYLFPHLPFLAPHPNTFSYYPHISPHLLKVWQSYHVTKFLWQSFCGKVTVAKLPCGEVTGNRLFHCVMSSFSSVFLFLKRCRSVLYSCFKNKRID